MYRARTDALLTIPFGSSIRLRGTISDDIESDSGVLRVDAQIRDQHGQILSTFETDEVRKRNQQYEYNLFTDDLLPVGLHYMDLRIQGATDVIHTEIIQINVLHSVTNPITDDPQAMDKRYI